MLGGRLTDEQAAAAAREAEGGALKAEGRQAAALIPQYRAIVIKAKAACTAMRERLAEGQTERDALREEVGLLQQVVKERSDAMLQETAGLRARMEQQLRDTQAAVQAKESQLEKEYGRVQVQSAPVQCAV